MIHGFQSAKKREYMGIPIQYLDDLGSQPGTLLNTAQKQVEVRRSWTSGSGVSP